SAYPLCAPNGTSAPSGGSNITAGSSVARPCASIRQPGGTLDLRLYATRIFPYAMALVAKSSRIGSAPRRGIPTVNGFVKKRGCAPPYGATIACDATALVKWIDANPAAMACSAQ